MRLLHYADLENAADDPERAGRLAGLIEELRDPETVVVGGGDNTAPGVLSLATGGRHALDFFQRIAPDLDVLGNHDFDHGLAATREIVRDSPQTWLCANLELDGDRFGKADGVEAWTILERGSERVGVFGVTAPETPEITPEAEPLTATDPIGAAREAIRELRARDVDRIVALSHLGTGDDDLASAVDADVILGGHAHEPRLDRVDGTLVARPGAGATGLLEVELADEVTAVRHDPSEVPVDEAVATALRERKVEAGLADVVASVEEPIERDREAVFGGESRIGHLVAEAYRWATGADVGLQNSGGLRMGPPLTGEITAADLVGLVPFEERVAVVELTGRELREVLRERNGNAVSALRADRWYGHVIEASTTWDGDELSSVLVGGEPLDPGRAYLLATSDYLLGTPHEFPTLTPERRVETTDRPQYEVVVEYVRSVGIDPDSTPATSVRNRGDAAND